MATIQGMGMTGFDSKCMTLLRTWLVMNQLKRHYLIDGNKSITSPYFKGALAYA